MRRATVGLALAPLLGFPLFVCALVLADVVAGEGLFIYQLQYEQRRLATDLAWDFVRALPFTYLAAALVVGVGFGLRLGGRRALTAWMAASGAVLGLLLGAALAGSLSDPSALAIALAGTAFAATLAVPLGWLRDVMGARGGCA